MGKACYRLRIVNSEKLIQRILQLAARKSRS